MDIDIDPALLIATFQQEAEELLGELERLALDLDERPTELVLVEEMFRLSHTLKGSASCVGAEHVLALAHELETMFETITTHKRRADRKLSSLTLRAVDVLRGLVRRPDQWTGALPEDGEVLVTLARAWLEQAGGAADGAAAWTNAKPEAAAGPRTLRVDVARLDALLNLAGEVAIAQGRMRTQATADDGSAWQTFEALSHALQESIMRLRLVPLGATLERFRRPVRDLSVRAGKQAELVVEGAEVEVDVTLADALRDPLLHMVRNAIDHGIEPPETRRALGKDPVGRITLRARHDGNYVVIEVSDDGAGIDTERLLDKAAALGIARPEAAVSELCFAPGLSTAEAVTELSGRGIGMDVVRRDIEAMRGSVSLENAPGRGLTVSLRVPLTVTVIQGFGVRVGGETYILPVDSIREVMDLDRERAIRSEQGGVLELRGKPLPFVDLAQHFKAERDANSRQSIVVLEHGTQRAGLEVDALVGEVQTVIKPLGPLFSSIKNVAGSAVMADGRVALVLDVGSLLRSVA
ncbi:MAG TPA: chemotaxis protein CheW [Polyangiaceae bacterium]|nr:chemotaxis protein CheW [Polyangiaceae bacterium]